MHRVLLVACLSLFATHAFATPTVCSDEPVQPRVKAEVASTTAVTENNTPIHVGTSPATNISVGAAHGARPRIISPRWQSLLPGMIR